LVCSIQAKSKHEATQSFRSLATSTFLSHFVTPSLDHAPLSSLHFSGVQRGGGERGDGPGHPRQGGIQRVKLQNLNAVTRLLFLL